MAFLDYVGAESGDMLDVQASGGTITSQSTTVIGGGAYSYRVNPTTTAVGWATLGYIGVNGVLGTTSVAAFYFSFKFRGATRPASGSEEMFGIRQGTNERFWIRLNSSGNMEFYDSTLTLLATGSTVLSTSTAYRISGVVNMGASATVTINIDGVTEFTSSTVNTGATNFTIAIIGKRTNRSSQSVDFYYDDFITDTTTEPGDWKIDGAVPIANGSTMQWTAGTGSSNYQEVDEIPRSTTEYVMTTSTAGDVALFTTQSMSTLGISGATVKSVRMIAHLQENVAVTSSNKVRMRSNGTNLDSTTARNLTATSSETLWATATDPSGGGAWTEARVDALEIGSVEANAVAVRMNQTMKFILYEPAAAAGVSNLPLLGVG